MAESSTLYAETAGARPSAVACVVTKNKSDFGRKPAPPTLATIEKGEPSADRTPKTVLELALSLLFREIAHQARSIGNAMGAAIWLLEGETPVRSAYCGSNAPQVSTYLTHCAAGSWKAGKMQLSQDANVDSRLDSGAWRRLGVRSFVVMPVSNKDKAVVAIVEVFSRHSHAFLHRDLLFLKDLCRRVADNIAEVEHVQRGIFAMAEPSPTLPSFSPSPRVPWFGSKKLASRGYGWNLLIGGLTILAAIFLGWILGSREHEDKFRNEAIRPALRQEEATQLSPESAADTLHVTNQVAELGPASTANPSLHSQDRNDENQIPPADSVPRARAHSKRPAPESVRSENSSDGLVIFEKGKQIFPPESPSAESSTGNDRNESGLLIERRAESPEPIVIVGEDIAGKHLLQRVEPEYSESARQQRLQGTVILDIHVGKRGTVAGISRVSGDPQLALLAAKAVRQWKFSPLLRNGTPVSFESQITLSFALP